MLHKSTNIAGPVHSGNAIIFPLKSMHYTVIGRIPLLRQQAVNNSILPIWGSSNNNKNAPNP